MGSISSGGYRMVGVEKRGRFGGGHILWSLACLCADLGRACAAVSYWLAMRWRVACSNSTTCCMGKRKRAAISAPYISLQSCNRERLHTEWARCSLLYRDTCHCHSMSLRCAWRCSACRCTSHADSWRRRAESSWSRCACSLACVYSRAAQCSKSTAMSASLDSDEDSKRVAAGVVIRYRGLATVEASCTVPAVSGYRLHGGLGSCRSIRRGRFGATRSSAGSSRERVVLTCSSRARRTHLVSAVGVARVSCHRRSWMVGATSRNCGVSWGVTATTPLAWFHVLHLLGLGGRCVAPGRGEHHVRRAFG